MRLTECSVSDSHALETKVPFSNKKFGKTVDGSKKPTDIPNFNQTSSQERPSKSDVRPDVRTRPKSSTPADSHVRALHAPVELYGVGHWAAEVLHKGPWDDRR